MWTVSPASACAPKLPRQEIEVPDRLARCDRSGTAAVFLSVTLVAEEQTRSAHFPLRAIPLTTLTITSQQTRLP